MRFSFDTISLSKDNDADNKVSQRKRIGISIRKHNLAYEEKIKWNKRKQ
jgi:hypothetical protein